MQTNILKKIFVKLIKALGFEIIDQNQFKSPTLNKELNEQLSNINKSIVLPLGEVNLSRKISDLLIIFRTNSNIEIWDQNKKRIFEKGKIEYVKRLKGFWKTGVEEEATIILSSKEIPIINISLSITKWRSTFQINGNGYRGYWRLDGRGRSYGNQTYIVGKRWGWLSGKKQKYTEKILSNSKEDKVFFNEMNSILKKIKSYKTDTKLCDEKDAIKTMKLIKDIYAF